MSRNTRPFFLLGLLSILCAGACQPSTDSASSVVFSYTNAAGRQVFVNDLSFVPERYRMQVRAVDLTDVSLNTELAADLEQQTRLLLRDLLASDVCRQKRQRASRGWVATLWEEYDILLLFGLLLLSVLLVSPYIMRRVAPSQWGRFLMLAIPGICVIAVLSFSMVRTSKALGEARAEAEPCRPERYLFPADTPELRQRKTTMIQKLQRMVEKMHETRLEKIQQAVQDRQP